MASVGGLSRPGISTSSRNRIGLCAGRHRDALGAGLGLVDGPTPVAAKPELHEPAHQRRVVDDEDRARHTLLARGKLGARGRRAIVVAGRVSGGRASNPARSLRTSSASRGASARSGPPALSNACSIFRARSEQDARLSSLEEPASFCASLTARARSSSASASACSAAIAASRVAMRLLVILSVLAQAETEAPDGHVVDWVQKPLDDVQLLAALEHAVAGRDEPFKLLVVEDDEDLAGVLTASFDRHGIQTFHAADGAQAILISQRELPDLLVLDLGLPDVDGFAVVEWLRRHELLHAMPMVVYTARDLDDSDRRRLRLGPTTQFVTKGRITSSDLEQRVMGLLGRLTPATRRENADEPEAHPVGR